MRGLPRRVGVAGKVLAVAIGLTIALPAVAAGAVGNMTASLAHLHVPKHICGQLVCAAADHLTVTATVPLLPADLPDVATHRIALRVWGEDTFSDDLLQGPVYIPFQAQAPTTISPHCSSENQPGNAARSYFYRVPGYLKIRGCLRTTFSGYNEDSGVFDNRDEVYVGVRLLNSAGATVRSKETNRVYGNF
jgi:hypothetical protein